MWSSTAFAVSSASLLFLTADAAGLYTKNSPVLQVDAPNYKRLISLSNYTSIVEFYAPWCGHCQNLKPAFEKAAKGLQGVAKVAAVNCDEEINKPLCSNMGIKGFPTLKIVRPGKKAGKPVVEDYQQQRTAKAIIDAMKERIPNHVKKLTDKTANGWLEENKETPKVILFTEKSTTADFFKALAIDYLGSISFAQIKDSSKTATEMFDISKGPTIVLVPVGDEDKVVYDGELKKDAIHDFLTQVATPNQDPPPEVPKPKKTKKDAKKASNEKKTSANSGKAASSNKDGDSATMEMGDSDFTVEPMGQPTESPSPQVDTQKPTVLEEEPFVKQLNNPNDLNRACFASKSQICILALLPASMDKTTEVPEDVATALTGLGDLQAKISKRHKLFPFYAVPAANAKSKAIRDVLNLKSDDHVEIIATNTKRSWWRHYSGSGYSLTELETWIDAIRMNEGKRESLPESLIVDYTANPAGEESGTEATKPEQVPEPSTAAPAVEEATPEAEATPNVVDKKPAEAEPQPEATPEEAVEVPEAAETATIRDEL